MTKAVITGTFSEVKFIKTRSVMQLCVEIPIEQADMALHVLGGVPQPGNEVHVAVARLSTHEEPKPKKGSLAQQAGILCDDPVFRTFLKEYLSSFGRQYDDPAEAVRDLCEVESRAQFDTELVAAARWRELKGKYDAWKLL
jgi:hypothetical protein